MNVLAIRIYNNLFKNLIDNSIDWSNLSLCILHVHRYNYVKNYIIDSHEIYIYI